MGATAVPDATTGHHHVASGSAGIFAIAFLMARSVIPRVTACCTTPWLHATAAAVPATCKKALGSVEGCSRTRLTARSPTEESPEPTRDDRERRCRAEY